MDRVVEISEDIRIRRIVTKKKKKNPARMNSQLCASARSMGTVGFHFRASSSLRTDETCCFG